MRVPMLLYECQLTFHDVLFYETRTLGRLYETGRLLHNIALCYALGFATTTYHHVDDVPKYAEEIEALNAAGIYVTPAAGLEVAYAVHTFKLGDERNAVRMEKSNVNLPNYGRAKEVLIGSRFRFAVISAQALKLPKWVRMGLWMGKAALTTVKGFPVEIGTVEGRASHTVSRYPMNPTDLPDSAALKLFDLISMRPSSLVENAEIEAEAWWQAALPDGERLMLPAGLRHRFGP